MLDPDPLNHPLVPSLPPLSPLLANVVPLIGPLRAPVQAADDGISVEQGPTAGFSNLFSPVLEQMMAHPVLTAPVGTVLNPSKQAVAGVC